MNIRKLLLVSFAAAVGAASPIQSVLAADGYNTAFQTCQTAILEKFNNDESLKVKRKSFRKQGKVYKVLYTVRRNSDGSDVAEKNLVTCRTNRKGELLTLEMSLK
jgi:spermidine/putrescine-binding protein